MISVRFENVSKNFGANTVVRDLSLEVRPGELFFLLGPSGCGKTTSLRLVAGFYTPDQGILRFDERVMNPVPPHKRNTGMVFQNYALWPHLTVRGNVEYGLRVRKVPREERDRRTNEALAMVRLEELAARYPNQLSGGQQQRVALARALVIRPDVLLLDEPLSNLDAQLRLEMRREIKRLHQATGVTAIYVTHDQNEALSIADRVAVMKDGCLQQAGTPRDIYRVPQSRFVAEFMGESNFIPGTVKSVESDAVVVETPAGVLKAARREGRLWPEGSRVWCSVRPESFTLSEPGAGVAGGVNRLPAVLRDVTYLGETEQLALRLGEGSGAEAEPWRDLRVSVLNPREAQPPAGSSAVLHCSPDDVVVLSA